MLSQNEARYALDILNHLIEHHQVQGLLSGFLTPLINHATSSVETPEDNSIKMNLNIYTTTGRLACRKPNLQNIPIASKKYNIRECFRARPGKVFVIFDYSQLELRLLAHITEEPKMIEGFKRGGDFHSRTAAGMFDHVKSEFEENKKVLREKKLQEVRERGGDASTAGLQVDFLEIEAEALRFIKDKYKAERAKAKTCNFAIVYGITKFGLQKQLFANSWAHNPFRHGNTQQQSYQQQAARQSFYSAMNSSSSTSLAGAGSYNRGSA